MHGNQIGEHRWGVILAGGEGARLRSLTRFIVGDDRPKQFCPLLGGKTLLAQTRRRIGRLLSCDRTQFVLVRSHQDYYANELADVPAALRLVQPGDRGTLPAMLYSLLQIVRVDPRAAVAFFPSDHYYADEANFMAAVKMGFESAEKDGDSVILLGAPATHPETEYGWIESEAVLSSQSHNGVLPVKHFWEKPSQEMATDLLQRGCVWNTLVMVGLATGFLAMIRACAPEFYHAFAVMNSQRGPEIESELLGSVYAALPSADVSKRVLEAAPARLRVLRLGNVGWSDLGSPERLLEVARRTGEKNELLDLWERNAGRAMPGSDNAPVVGRVRSTGFTC